MTDFEAEYVFSKDSRLELILKCLFAKASTANAGAWALEAPPSSPGASAHLHLKQHTPIQRVLDHTLKVAILSSNKILSFRYLVPKLHIYTLGTSETYFTSCKKGRNRSPLNCILDLDLAYLTKSVCVTKETLHITSVRGTDQKKNAPKGGLQWCNTRSIVGSSNNLSVIYFKNKFEEHF